MHGYRDSPARAAAARPEALRARVPGFDRFDAAGIRSGGVALHLDVLAVGAGRPCVVFHPGTGGYALQYAELLLALADRGLNVVGLDPRGHGRSGGAPGSYILPELLEDLRAAIAYARGRFRGPVAAAGSSQGGIVAFYAAALGAPDAAICHNLADLGAPAATVVTRIPRLGRWLAPLTRAAARLAPEAVVPLPLYLDLAAEPSRAAGDLKAALAADPLATPYVRLKTLAALSHTPLPVPIEAIATPTLVLQGGADTIFPAGYVEGLYDRLTCDKRLVLLPGRPHDLLRDYPGDVVDPIAAWVEAL